MDSSPNLTLPYLVAAQAQKHVTHNEAIRALDALVQLMVFDKDLASPPGSPADGNRYIVATSPTGAWAGQAGNIAAWQDGAWAFFTPHEGWLAWVADEDKVYAHSGTAWAELTASPGSGASIWGINATADTTNRLAVKSTASLFDNVGNGHQQKINKAAAGDTASTLYQTNYSGRAEFGLAGDDNFHVKVSADGSTWKEALIIDRSTGAVRLPLSSQIVAPQGRLTLVSGTPVVTSDQAAKTTIYYTPYAGSVAPFWDGTSWTLIGLAELSLALDSSSGHTGYHQSGKNFDLFLDANSGTPRLVSGPAWTNDTTRASDIARQNGVWLNAASMTARFGTNSGDTATIAASRATWVGTFRASADGQTEYVRGGIGSGGASARLLLWNAYNRVPVGVVIGDSDDSWSKTSSGTRSANASDSMRCSFVTGLAEDEAFASYSDSGKPGTGAFISAGVGFDSNTTFSGRTGFQNNASNAAPIFGDLTTVAMGFHYFQALEYSSNNNTATFYGDSGVPPIAQNGLYCRLRM
jgi:hypothetical protein